VVYKRLADPEFKLLVTDYSRMMLDEAVGKRAMVAGRAVEVLTAALDDDLATIRVRAATTWGWGSNGFLLTSENSGSGSRPGT
jgi:hypothetical protein